MLPLLWESEARDRSRAGRIIVRRLKREAWCETREEIGKRQKQIRAEKNERQHQAGSGTFVATEQGARTLKLTTNPSGAHCCTIGLRILGTWSISITNEPLPDWILCSGYAKRVRCVQRKGTVKVSKGAEGASGRPSKVRAHVLSKIRWRPADTIAHSPFSDWVRKSR